MIRTFAPAFALALSTPAFAAAPPVTPTTILADAPAADWVAISPDHLMVMELADGGRVAILLAPRFAPVHVANIEAMARTHWYDGLWIDRVQDGYVTQWGDPDGKKPLPAGTVAKPPAEYERAAAGLAFKPLPYRDTFAPQVGIADGWPAAREGGRAWLTHCYGMVGVGRDNAPDTGAGTELYAIIGQPARALDRNIAVVGRVVSGIDRLAALPRGAGAMGFYDKPAAMLPITRVRLAVDLPEGERPRLEMLRAESASFAAWVRAKANRKDDFYVRPAGAIDVCSVLPPVRAAAATAH
ncbi:peptidylprolyl isomerase [Sphingomonas bacterium]|uniref:peptidylprolyl isomerase n=1 Tax=Sphingomonas bacterium TaxID=1895847 RepID=UPI00157667B8|nr:peptidylprolyl isomerase [Sphingomonas bacterium]